MSSFTFQFDETDLTSTVALSQALVMKSSAAVALGAPIAEVRKEVAVDSEYLSGWLNVSWNANEHPATATAGEVVYTFDATKTDNLLGDLADWELLSSAQSSSVTSAVGYADDGPETMKQLVDGARVQYKFHESVLPKRIWSAYGANVLNLLENQAALETEINDGITTATTNITDKFDASAADTSTDGAGYMMFGQAVTAASAEEGHGALSQRIESMTSLVADGGTATFDSTTNKFNSNFVFAVGDEVHMNVKFTTTGADAAEPQVETEAAELLYRLILKVKAA